MMKNAIIDQDYDNGVLTPVRPNPDALDQLHTDFDAIQAKTCNLSVMQRLTVRLASKVRADSDLDEDTESLLVELEVLLESLAENARLIVEDMDHMVPLEQSPRII